MVSQLIVLEKIRVGFQSLPYPGDQNIVYDNTGNHLECVKIQKELEGKHWSEVSPETLVRENSALCFMTPSAFRFYLPAYLSQVVQDFQNSDVLPENIMQFLTLPTEIDTLNKLNFFQQHLNGGALTVHQVLMKQLEESNQRVHEFIERMLGLNYQQSQAIRYYLEYLKTEKEDCFLFNEPQIAIYRYWFMFNLDVDIDID